MVKRPDFIEYLLELLKPLGPVRAQRMFGGYGLFLDELMFGLVANDVLYLKTDAGNRAAFEAHRLPPFTYERAGKPAIVMSYHRAPEDALEDSAELCRWARDAASAARRNVGLQGREKKRKSP